MSLSNHYCHEAGQSSTRYHLHWRITKRDSTAWPMLTFNYLENDIRDDNKVIARDDIKSKLK